MTQKSKWIFGILAAFIGLSFLFFGLALFGLVSSLSMVSSDTYEETSGSGVERVAIVELSTPITDSEEIISQLEKFRNRSNVKAIVLFLNSPGGAVAPSQEIFSEVRKTKNMGKPVVVSMGSVAASGAYYIACAANSIVANPGSITGSIGVISEFKSLKGLFDKIGIESTTIKSGKFKDVGNPSRAMTQEDRAQLQSIIDDVYEQFIADVAAARDLPLDSVRKLADGRIFTGRQAYKNGLIDTLGTLQTAISIAGFLGKIEGNPKTVRERKRQSLFDRFMGTDASTTIREMRNKISSQAPLEYRLSY